MSKKAFMLSVDLETGEHNLDIFDGDNPIRSARQLQYAVEEDWPSRKFFVDGNEEAREAYGKWRTEQMFGKD